MDPVTPQVYINVNGGISEYMVTRGDVEVIQIDWDEWNGGYTPDAWAVESYVDRALALEGRPDITIDLIDVIKKALLDEEWSTDEEEIVIEQLERLLTPDATQEWREEWAKRKLMLEDNFETRRQTRIDQLKRELAALESTE